jgi:hypothetical protein
MGCVDYQMKITVSVGDLSREPGTKSSPSADAKAARSAAWRDVSASTAGFDLQPSSVSWRRTDNAPPVTQRFRRLPQARWRTAWRRPPQTHQRQYSCSRRNDKSASPGLHQLGRGRSTSRLAGGR